MIDVLYARDGGQRPHIVITDSGSYTDLVFGLVHLLGMSYRPQLADLPDQQLWRIRPDAGYGPLDTAARGKIDLGKVRRHWPDILRVAASIHAGAVRAYDVIRMLQRDGHPTPLGEAITSYRRIFKSLHILAYVDDEADRRDIKGQSNLTEGRHDLGLVLNCIVRWNTFYMNAALEQLRAEGYPVRDEDLAWLSPFVRHHLACTAATRSCCPTSPAASARCATRTTKTTTGSSPGPRPRVSHKRPIPGRSVLVGRTAQATSGWASTSSSALAWTVTAGLAPAS